MENFLYVMLGGGIGAVLRYVVTSILQKWFSLEHYATFWVNITGCFIFGILIAKLSAVEPLYFFFLTGLAASYTTFSTFEYENIDLIAHERYFDFLKYSVLSCICGVTAVLTGILAAQLF